MIRRKMSCVIINIAFMIICNFVLPAGCQNITVCSNPVKGRPCSLTCTTPDSNEDVKFFLGSVEKGSCIGGTGICTGDVSQSGSVTTLSISSLSKTAHEGSWTCSYKNLQSSSQTLQVYTEPSVTEFINVSSTTPSSNEFKTVNLAARSYCFFPSVPTAELYYNDTKSSTKVSDYSVVGVPSSKCETYELDLQVNATVSKNQLSGKTVYFYFQFTSALGTTYRTTNDLGPYTFEVETTSGETCTSSFPCGFLPVWLILILIDVVICILVWKKVLKIGGFFKKKKIIIAIFIGVAIVAMVIGVILGIYMKCPNCGITVVASIAIGLFIAIVQWIFIMFWICKKEFYRAVIKITGETKYTDELGDCKSEAYKNLSDRVIKAIESLYENVEGRQTVMDINFSPGLKVTFDLSSQGFSDCSVLSDTLENALQKGVISSFKVSSVGFEFMPLQDWKDSKG